MWRSQGTERETDSAWNFQRIRHAQYEGSREEIWRTSFWHGVLPNSSRESRCPWTGSDRTTKIDRYKALVKYTLNEAEPVACRGSLKALSADVISDVRSSESHDSEMNSDDYMKYLNLSSDSEDGSTSHWMCVIGHLNFRWSLIGSTKVELMSTNFELGWRKFIQGEKSM